MNPIALVAVASAPLCSISAISAVIRPCITAPSDHCTVSSTANQMALRASGAASACQRKAATPASSSANCTSANHCAARDIGGWYSCICAMLKAGLGKRSATSAGRQLGGLTQTLSLSSQLRACQLSCASPA
ncbi:hypothetical protein D3C71_1074950 [compost metagenome]